jgi:hypothetical protein
MRKWRRAISLEELCSKSLIHRGYFLQILAFSRQGHNPKLSVDYRQTRSLLGPGIAISLNKRMSSNLVCGRARGRVHAHSLYSSSPISRRRKQFGHLLSSHSFKSINSFSLHIFYALHTRVVVSYGKIGFWATKRSS